MKILRSLLLSFVCLISLHSQSYAQVQTSIQNAYQYFSISGSAVVRVKPDRVSLTVGIHERSLNLSDAKINMAHTMNDVIAFCKRNGVEQKNIQTAKIQINPEYRYGNENDIELKYYDVQQSLTITITDVDKYNEIVYGLLDIGINTIDNIEFYSSEARKYRDQARLNAIQAAKEKASLLTDAVGIKLGRIVDVLEEGGYASYYMQRSRMMMNSQNVYQAPSSDNVDKDGMESAAGMINVSSTVRLTYKILD